MIAHASDTDVHSEVFGGDLGAAYLGMQGDVRDAHEDMALASLGALVAHVAVKRAKRVKRGG